MNREIKFRGQAVDTGEWVTGDLITLNKRFDAMIFDGEVNIAVDPETVGEYTCIKDRNGQEIYEGDIVQYEIWHGGPEHHVYEKNNPEEDWKRPFKIVWKDCKYKMEPLFENYPSADLSKNYLNEELEVIGNIYENHELLEAT